MNPPQDASALFHLAGLKQQLELMQSAGVPWSSALEQGVVALKRLLPPSGPPAAFTETTVTPRLPDPDYPAAERPARLEPLPEQQRHERLLSLGLLAAGMAEELSAHISGIQQLAHHALGTATSSTDPGQLAAWHDVVRRSEACTAILLQIHQFIQKAPETVAGNAFTQVIRSACELLQGFAEHRQIALDVQHAADLPAIAIDPQRLRQLLLHLLAQAIVAQTAGTTVSVRLHELAGGIEVVVRPFGFPAQPPGAPPESLVTAEGEDPRLTPVRDLVADLRAILEVVQEAGGKTSVRLVLPGF